MFITEIDRVKGAWHQTSQRRDAETRLAWLTHTNTPAAAPSCVYIYVRARTDSLTCCPSL